MHVVRYSFAAFLFSLAGIDALVGSPWYVPLGVAVTAGVIAMGRHRIFRAGIRRTDDGISCRYIPWYEGNAYVATALVPMMSFIMIVAGSAPGYPPWFRFGGLLVLAITPLTVYGTIRLWRRSQLCLTPSQLTVQVVERGTGPRVIHRNDAHSIRLHRVRQGPGANSVQVALICRCPSDGRSEDIETVLLGAQLTLQPINLFNALIAWKDGATEDPTTLLDRIERILRGA